MVAGGAKTDILSLATGASVSVQPAAGETWKITTLSIPVGDSTNASYAEIYDGSNAVKILEGDTGTSWEELNLAPARIGVTNEQPALALYINNTDYLQITNEGTGTELTAYSGVQLI